MIFCEALIFNYFRCGVLDQEFQSTQTLLRWAPHTGYPYCLGRATFPFLLYTYLASFFNVPLLFFFPDPDPPATPLTHLCETLTDPPDRVPLFCPARTPTRDRRGPPTATTGCPSLQRLLLHPGEEVYV